MVLYQSNSISFDSVRVFSLFKKSRIDANDNKKSFEFKHNASISKMELIKKEINHLKPNCNMHYTLYIKYNQCYTKINIWRKKKKKKKQIQSKQFSKLKLNNWIKIWWSRNEIEPHFQCHFNTIKWNASHEICSRSTYIYLRVTWKFIWSITVETYTNVLWMQIVIYYHYFWFTSFSLTHTHTQMERAWVRLINISIELLITSVCVFEFFLAKTFNADLTLSVSKMCNLWQIVR